MKPHISADTHGYRLWVGGPVPPQAEGITIGRTIIVRKRAAESPWFEQLIRHELTHVEQWQQLGFRRFLTQYLGEYFRNRAGGVGHRQAYLDISLEQAARQPNAPAKPVTLFAIQNAHRRLEHSVENMHADDFFAASALPGYTVGDVIGYLRNHAEGHASSGDLESDRSVAQQLREANRRFEAAWSVENQFQGLERLRVVEVHHGDCIARNGFPYWSQTYVDADLSVQISGRLIDRLTASHPGLHMIDEQGNHHTIGPGAVRLPAVHTTKRELLAWALGRHSIPAMPVLRPPEVAVEGLLPTQPLGLAAHSTRFEVNRLRPTTQSGNT